MFAPWFTRVAHLLGPHFGTLVEGFDMKLRSLFSASLRMILAVALALPQVGLAQTSFRQANVGSTPEITKLSPQTIRALGEIFVDRPKLLDAFLDAILDSENPKKVQALGIQLGANEAVFQQLSRLVMERSKTDPGLADLLKKNAETVSEALKDKPLAAPNMTERVLEFLFFTGSYIGILYSLNGIDPMMAEASFDSAFQQNMGMYTILLVIMARQGMGLASASREYFKSLRDRRNSAQFFKSFQSWMNTIPFLKKMQAVELAFHPQNVSEMSSDGSKGLTAEVFDDYFAELKKLEAGGLLTRFLNYKRRGKIKNHLMYYLSYLTPEEKSKLLSAHPDQTFLSKMKFHYHSRFTYEAIKMDILEWMEQEKVHELSELRAEIQQRIESGREELSKRTRLSTLEKINIRVLTIGTILLGGAVSMSAAPANFDWFFSESLMESLRTEQAKNYLGLATFILPAFSLMLHEFSWIRDLKKRLFNRRSTSRLHEEVQRLEAVLNVLTVLELDPNPIGPLGRTTNRVTPASMSTQKLIEMMAIRLDLSFSYTRQCEKLLRARDL